MFRLILDKLQKVASPVLGLGIYSTTRKIRDLFVSEINKALIAEKPYAQDLYRKNLLAINIANLAHFETLLAQTLNTIIGENYKFYQTLTLKQKADFRTAIVQVLLQALNEVTYKTPKMIMTEEGIEMNFEFPPSFFNPIFLKQRLTPLIEFELVSFAQGKVASLAEISPSYWLPTEIRAVVVNKMLFFQTPTESPTNSQFNISAQQTNLGKLKTISL